MDRLADSTCPLTHDPVRSEMRIAFAMSGAIALVLYESGVAHEVHAFLNRQGAYRDAVETARLNPVVDILTGASAGGINSVFLGNCFVTGGDFSAFTDVWIEMAGVDILRYGPGQEPKSVLNVEMLRQKMGDIFRSNVQAYKAKHPRFVPQKDQIKVRLCRTDLRGFCVSTVDAAGHRIDVPSRSDVVGFDNRAFETEDVDDLVDAAAATSAFPVAFPPVFNNGRWYVDGGLWDNQPIDLAVEAIKDKPAYSRTHRCVLFVDPEPSIVAEVDDLSADPKDRRESQRLRAESERRHEPSVLETAAFIPGMGVKGNVLPALESILDYNRRIELYEQALDLPSLAAHLSEIVADIEAVRKEGDPFKRLSLLDQARMLKIFFDGDPKLIQSWFAIRERLGDDLQPLIDQMCDVLERLNEADLYRRAIRRELQEVNSELETCRDPGIMSHRKRELYDALDAINSILDISPDGVDDLIGTALAYREHRRERISRFWPASLRILERITKAMADPKGDTDGAIRAAKDEWLRQLLAVKDVPLGDDVAEHVPVIRFPTPVEISDVDRVRYVLASFSDLDGKRRVDLIRISPNDTSNTDLIGVAKAPPGLTPAAFKLAGEELGHFSGFLEERWRRNDFIWGRLDAAEILLRTLKTYAHREAAALGITPAFDEDVYRRTLSEVQTAILEEEARRYLPRDGKGTNPLTYIDPSKCASVNGRSAEEKAAIVAENRKLVGYGRQSIGDAVEPQFSRNVEYVTQTLVKALRGASSKTPAMLDRLGRISRVVSYAILAFTWVLPLKPNTVRAVWIRGAWVLFLGVMIFVWGRLSGDPSINPIELLTVSVEALFGALVLIAVGAGLGFRFQFALPFTLAIGVFLGMTLQRVFPHRLIAGLGADEFVAVFFASVCALMVLAYAVKSILANASRRREMPERAKS